MADAPLTDPFIGGEPSTHPAYAGSAPVETPPPAPTGVAGPAAAAPAAPLVVTPASAPTGVAGTTPAIAVADPFAIPPMTDATGQSNLEATQAPLDLMNPPTEFPLIKGTLQATGIAGGTVLGVFAGGGVADWLTVPAGGIMGGAAGSAAYDVFQNIADAVRGTKNAQGQSITLSQQAIEMMKGGFMGIGGTLGQATGKIMAQKALTYLGATGYLGKAGEVAASIIGGGVGTGAASFTADRAIAFGKIWGLIPPEYRTPEMQESLKEAINNGGLDMIVNLAMHSPLAVKSIAREAAFKINGITPEMIADAEVARSFGINLSMNNLSKRTMLNGLYRTVTSVIPVIGHPYHDLYGKQVDAMTGYARDMPNKVAPGGLPSEAGIGQEAMDRANAAFKPIADAYNDEHSRLMARAKAANVLFSTDAKNGIDAAGNPVGSLKDWASGELNYAKNRVTRQYDMSPDAKPGTLLPVEFGKTNVITENKQLLTLANKISMSPDRLTIDQLEALGDEADLIYKNAVEKGDPTSADNVDLHNRITALKDSLHGALTDSYSANPNAKSWAAIGEMVIQNDKQFADLRAAFTTPVGRKLLARNANPSAIGEAIFKMDDPAQVNQLRSVVGDDIVNKSAAVAIQHAVSDSIDGMGPKAAFNVDSFIKAFDLDNPSSKRYQAIDAALQTSPIKMADLLNFVKAAKSAGQGLPPNFATMIVRKMTFGGFNSIMKGLLPFTSAAAGAGVFGAHVGAIPTAGLVLMGWKGAQIMSNPAYLRDATTFLSTASGEAEARMALYRVAAAVLPNDQGYPVDTVGTGKTPPKTIMERAYNKAFQAEQSGSNFLQSLVPQ